MKQKTERLPIVSNCGWNEFDLPNVQNSRWR